MWTNIYMVLDSKEVPRAVRYLLSQADASRLIKGRPHFMDVSTDNLPPVIEVSKDGINRLQTSEEAFSPRSY